MDGAKRYEVRFSSLKSDEVEPAAKLLEGNPTTLDEILETCLRYRILAQIGDGGILVGTILPPAGRSTPFPR